MSFLYSFGDKRYHTLNYHLKQKYKKKVFKVSLNAGFTCPNRDGKVGLKGCSFCSAKGSGDFAGNISDDLITQFDKIKEMMHKKWPDGKYIAYFQANTNTYAPVDVLRDKFDNILKYDEDIVGISISTRPDCLPEDVLDYLSELNKKTNLWVELGLQSIHDKTTKYINRGHDYKCFIEGVNKLRNRNIDVIVHIINGLPGETKEMMIETAKAVSKLDVQGLKIHLLHVIKNTELAREYHENKFELLSQEEYIDILIKQLEIFPPELVIHRVTGDAVREDLIGPMWSLKKWEVLNSIDHELKIRNTYQGKYYNS